MNQRRALLLAVPLLLIAIVVVVRPDDDGGSTDISAGSDDVTTTTATSMPPPETTTTEVVATTTTIATKSVVVASGAGWSVRRTSSGEECLEVVTTKTERVCGLVPPARSVGTIGLLPAAGGSLVVAVTDGSVTSVDLSPLMGRGGNYGWAEGRGAEDPFLPGTRILTHLMANANVGATMIFRSNDDPVAMATVAADTLGHPDGFFDAPPTFGKRDGYRKVVTGLSWGIHEFGLYDGRNGETCLLFRRLAARPENEAPATTGDACVPPTGRAPIEVARVLPTSKPGFVDMFAAFNREVDGWRYEVAGRNPSTGGVIADPRNPDLKVPSFAGSVTVPETAETLTLIATRQGVEVARVELPIPRA